MKTWSMKTSKNNSKNSLRVAILFALGLLVPTGNVFSEEVVNQNDKMTNPQEASGENNSHSSINESNNNESNNNGSAKQVESSGQGQHEESKTHEAAKALSSEDHSSKTGASQKSEDGYDISNIKRKDPTRMVNDEDEDIKLQAIGINHDSSYCIIKGKILKPGDKFNEYVVVKIEHNKVILSSNNEEIEATFN